MYDVNVIESLVNIEIKILASFEKMSSCFSNKEKFDRELYFLNNVLLKKEDLLISKLPTSDDVLYIVYKDISDKKSNFFDNESQFYYVKERIWSIFEDLLIAIDDSTYSDDDYDYTDSLKLRKNIRDSLKIRYVKLLNDLTSSNDDLLNICFMNVYTSKKVSNYFCKNDFNYNNVSIVSDEVIMKDLSSDDYYSIKNDEIYSVLEDLVISLLETVSSDVNVSIIFYFMMNFKFLIHILDNGQLGVFNIYFSNLVKSVNDLDIIKEFISILDDEILKRGISSSEKNKNAPKIEHNNLDDFIKLIKLEGKIFSLFKLLDFDSCDYGIISSLQSLINIEEELLSNIFINKENEIVYKRLIESDLHFFLSLNDNDLSLISKRLFNIIPYFCNLSVPPTQSYFCYNYIKENHIIRSLKKYIDFLIDGNDFCDINYLKKIIYLNGFLTFDYLFSNGNYRLFEDLNDDIICDLLDINPMEYEFDKNEQLIMISENLVYDIENSMDDEDIYFKFLELEDIKRNLNGEYLMKFNKDIIPAIDKHKKI